MKEIKGFEDYFIDEIGNVYSLKKGYLHKMSPWIDPRGLYVQIGLSKNGTVYKKLIHRLVVEAFIDNPKNFPEVNHKDKNTRNNSVENLEWCSRKENLYQSYTTMSPVRNFKECDLYKDGIYIKSFKSVT